MEKETIMAVARDIGLKNYCDTVYTDFTEMKSRLLGIVGQIEHMTGPDRGMLASHVPHLREVVSFIDWKLDILTKACPFEWKGLGSDLESTAQVQIGDAQPFSGGYVGG
jgi:hypothetical protein